MRIFFRTTLVLAALSLSFSWAVYAAEFSADMISTASGQTMTAKIQVKDQKSRTEMPQAIMINRTDLGVAWILMPEQNMYMEQAIDPNVTRSLATEGAGEISREPLGRETIDGKPADKFKITYNMNGKIETILQWTGPGNVPIKSAAEDGSWSTEFHNIETSGVEDSLFEIPAGYQKFTMPMMPEGMGNPFGGE